MELKAEILHLAGLITESELKVSAIFGSFIYSILQFQFFLIMALSIMYFLSELVRISVGSYLGWPGSNCYSQLPYLFMDKLGAAF